MAWVRAFLEEQSLDEETVSYIETSLEDGEVDDIREFLSTFLSGDALDKLVAYASNSQNRSNIAAVARTAIGQTEGNSIIDVPTSEQVNGQMVDQKENVESVTATTPAKVRNKPKAKIKSKGKAASSKAETPAVDGSRELADVAAFGLAETEEGLDAFDSSAITGKGHLYIVKQAAKYRDIVLPAVHISIVSELGQKDLIVGSPLTLVRGHKYGLIGRNGSGKTTLLRRIARRALPGLPPLRYGYVSQELTGSDDSVLQVACSGDREYQTLVAEQARLEVALSCATEAQDSADLAQEFAEITERLDDIESSYGAEGLEGRAREVLIGLQFSPDMLSKPTHVLSGGWKMRLGLARALLSRADCLLLDEPTNHLDLVGVLWLQQYLKKLSTEVILLLISHDREFLDNVITDVVEIRHQHIEQGPGNYTAWEQRRSEEIEAISSKLESVERQEKRQAESVQRMKELAQKKGAQADPNKQRQAKERQIKLFGKVSSSGEHKTYGRIGLAGPNGGKFSLSYCNPVDIHELAAEKLASDGPKTKIKLPEPEQLSGCLLQLERTNFVIPGTKTPILRNVKVNLRPESRVAVVGANGAGKTTLLRLLEGEQWPDTGAHRHTKLKIAHVSQHHLETLQAFLNDNCIAYLRNQLPPPAPGGNPASALTNVSSDQDLHAYLANFALGPHARQKIGTLSGGQKARLAFAAQVWHRPHLLLLDEPTNHLDMEVLEALAEALQTFEGAAVIVSHNQHFLMTVCNELWTVDSGSVKCGGHGSDVFRSQFTAYRKDAVKKLRASAKAGA